MKSLSYVIFISILFESVGQVASDLYLPSLPAISVGLRTTIHLVQATVFLYMVGYSISRLIYGPISDAVGRKNPLIAGLLLSLLGTMICVFANSIGSLIIGRFLQGLGTGAGVIIGSAIIRDLLEGKDLAKAYSYMGLANIVLIVSGIISVLPNNTPLPIAIAFMSCGIVILLMIKIVSHTNSRKNSTTT